MDAQTTNFIIDLIPQGGFAGFLFYLYISIKNEMKLAREEAKKEEEKIRKEHREEENRIRARFEKVIEQLNQEKENFRSALYQEVGNLANRVSEIEKQVSHIKTKIDLFVAGLNRKN